MSKAVVHISWPSVPFSVTVETVVRYRIVHTVKVKVKESRNRPGVTQRFPGGLGSQICMTFGT
jgi:hypothetical protein